jgi:CheY-like chemotaxis protein
MARVLVVDDVEIVLKAMQCGVSRMGHETQAVSDSHQALALALQTPPDLALVDYRMPGMDGVALFAALNEALGARCPKVLFVTATPTEEVRLRCDSAGLHAVGFVKKPFHLDELLDEVKQALAA